MDDCFKSVVSDDNAILMIQDLISVCLTAGFQQTKWISKSIEVLQTYPVGYKSVGFGQRSFAS